MAEDAFRDELERASISDLEKRLAACGDDARALMELGRRWLKEGQAARALGLLSRARALEPDSVDARCLLGEAYYELEMLGPARVQFELATRRDPACADAWTGLGRVLRAKGEEDAAERALLRAREAAPGKPEPARELASLYGAREEWDRAVDALRPVMEAASPDADALAQLADALFHARAYEEARDACRRALAAAPGHETAGRLLRRIDAALSGRLPALALCVIALDEAENLRSGAAAVRDAFDEIVVVDTGSTDDTPAAARELGAKWIPFEWSDDFSAARNAAAAHASADWLLWLDADERIDPATVRRIRQALPEEPNAGFALRVRVLGEPTLEGWQARVAPRRPDIRFEGRAYERLEDSLERAGARIRRLDAVVERLPEKDEAKRLDAQHRNHKLLLQELKERPGDIPRRLQLARSYVDLGLSHKALACVRSLTAQPEPKGRDRDAWLYAHVVEGEILQGRGAMGEALAAFARALEAEPAYGPAQIRLGVLLAAQREYERARRVLSEALNREDALTTVLIPWEALRRQGFLVLGVCADAVGDSETAERCYRRTLDLDPNNADACVRLARLRTSAGARGEAVALYQRAERLRPQRADIHLGLGNVYFAAGEWAAARERYRRAIECAPDWPEGYFNASAAAYQQGDAAEALALCDRALALGLDTALAHRHRGRCLARRDRWEEALEEFAAALEMDPQGKAEVWEGIQIALDKGRPQQGARLCELLIERGEDAPGLFCLMGDFYLQLGAVDAAAAAYQAALDRRPDFQPARERLDALKEAGGEGASA